MSTDINPYAAILASQLRRDYHTDKELAFLCESSAKDLKIGAIDGVCFLKALMGVETSFGKDNIARHEPAYGPGGLYFQRSKELKDLYKIYGAPISCSYGPFQIMYATALNLGYPRTMTPSELWNGFVSAPYVVGYLNAQFKRGADTTEKLAQSYNTGGFSDPSASPYVKKFIGFYQQFKQ